MNFLPVSKQMELIRRGVEEILPEDELEKKLQKSITTNKPLKIKLGCDPSRPDLHIGHGVVLRKLRHFQDLGHQAILVIGDFTAMIGDPSGRNKTRPQLSLNEARLNAESYVKQSNKILDTKTLKVVYNSSWLNKMNFNDVVSLASSYTVARMLERDDFTRRFQQEIPILIHEFLYPLAQGKDSVELQSDVELGGTDQKFNLLVGRDLQKSNGQAPQCIITTPLLEGTDGVEKMSKSYGNHIGLHDKPEDMYGKTLSISDDMILKWLVLAADVDNEVLEKAKKQLKSPSNNPMEIKRDLARRIITLFYNQKAALKAEEYFNSIVVGKGIPKDIKEYRCKSDELIVNVMFNSGLLKSKGEARRMIKQGAVRLDGQLVSDINFEIKFKIKGEVILKIGKRRFLKVLI
ncbi:tyrosine--tRNA ligase [Candidatus Marinimicrobia bacterium]|jgi:tyrosyl-tRNA synthetase|nr:tyrosine--tRNA ligase [Candidatus Neomarinimicrobiota bacterium]MDC0383419.1 tyrosine--tRNA ligase [Candidatus Neomarinimicrobiota bacterium]